MVEKNDIVKYAKRNTSPKMSVEERFVTAFLDALINSTDVEELYDVLKGKMWNELSNIIITSYWESTAKFMEEPWVSIIAYAMLKKGYYTYETISKSIFTGIFQTYQSTDLDKYVAEYTDDPNLSDQVLVTDYGFTTDMSYGLIKLGFINFYSTEKTKLTLPDGSKVSKYIWQDYDTYSERHEKFYDFLTLVKPARCGAWVFSVPVIYLDRKSEYISGATDAKFYNWKPILETSVTSENITVFEFTGEDESYNLGQILSFYGDFFSYTTNLNTKRISFIVRYSPGDSPILNRIAMRTSSTGNASYVCFNVKDIIAQQNPTEIGMFRVDIGEYPLS